MLMLPILSKNNPTPEWKVKPKLTRMLGFLLIALWLTGCNTPFIPTPLPTQRPGAISTIVAQTAAAAQTRTATFAPTATDPPTQTPTRKPTPTNPAPTQTPIETPTATSVTVLRNFYRVRGDATNGRFEDSTRADATGVRWPPQVNPAYTTQNLTSSTERVNLTSYGWEDYVRWLLNDDGRLFDYATGPHLALFNKTGWPQMELLLFGNNVVIAETGNVKWGWARIITMDYQEGPPDPYTDFQSTPWFIQKFTTVNKFEAVDLSAKGAVYYPIVSSRNLYVPTDWLEPFPSVPRTEQVKITDLPIYVEPSLDSLVFSSYHKDQSFQLLGYAPRGSKVWGLVREKNQNGWVMLYTPKEYPYYLTSWEMATDPPP